MLANFADEISVINQGSADFLGMSSHGSEFSSTKRNLGQYLSHGQLAIGIAWHTVLYYIQALLLLNGTGYQFST